MCRVVSFISAKGGVGKTSLIFHLSKGLAKMGFKVCDFDMYFGMNFLSQNFQTDCLDLKEYITSNAGTDEVLAEVQNGLFVVKTNSPVFDYLAHFELIKFFIDEISEKFDFIFLDTNSLNSKILNLSLESANEVCLVTDDAEQTIRNSVKLLQKTCKYPSIKNKTAIVNKARIIGEINGRNLGAEDIEEILKTEIIFVFPKFFKHNYLAAGKNVAGGENLIRKFCKSFVSNQNFSPAYKKKFLGLSGFVRRKLYAKYE